MVPELMGPYREWRKELLDLLERYGLSPRFTAGIEAGAQELKALSRNAAMKYHPEISEAAHKYAERQIEQLAKAGVAVPSVVPSVSVLTSSDFETATSTWVDVVRGRLIVDVARLRMADDEIDLVARLLAVKLVDRRASTWRHGRNTMVSDAILATWAAGNGIAGDIFTQAQVQTDEVYQRQAIAAIDENTTDCCLRVHGQIVSFDNPFHLTGTPRFASHVHAPPFHWNCRTAVTVYRKEMESFGVTTDQMRDAAREEIGARRRTKKRVVIHPAHATSRRAIRQ